MNADRKYRGFILLELLIVIALAGMLATLAIVPVNRTLADNELTGAAGMLVADIRSLQQMSVNGGDNAYKLCFINDATPRYNLTAGAQTLRKVYFPSSVKLKGQPKDIAFRLDGMPVSGEQTVEIQSKVTGKSLFIKLAPVTGRVRIAGQADS